MYLFQTKALLSLPFNTVKTLFAIMLMLQMANSCVNPIIYSKLHTSFRHAILKLFCACCVDRVKNYGWDDFGGNFKSVVTQSFRYASTRMTRFSKSGFTKHTTAGPRGGPAVRYRNDNMNHNKDSPAFIGRQVDASPISSSSTVITTKGPSSTATSPCPPRGPWNHRGCNTDSLTKKEISTCPPF